MLLFQYEIYLFLLIIQEFKMGSTICCTENLQTRPKIKVTKAQKKDSSPKNNCILPDTSSTSDSQTQNRFFCEPVRTQKVDNFMSFIKQRDLEVSSIRKHSSVSQEFSQHKTFIKFLERLPKQMSLVNENKDQKVIEVCLEEGKKYNINEKLFIEHSAKCAICYELFQNFKNMQTQEGVEIPAPETENRKSLRDSLLEFDQCQKAKRCAQCKCQVLNSNKEAQKAMRKFPNSNKYQSKNLKFRKTSLFQPQIHEERQSQESY